MNKKDKQKSKLKSIINEIAYDLGINKKLVKEVLILTFKELNLNYEKIKKNAVTNEIENNLIKQTKIAKSKGIFGAPTFIVEKELFWGDDRFEDAIKWYNK